MSLFQFEQDIPAVPKCGSNKTRCYLLKQQVRERHAETQTRVERVTDMQTDRQIRQEGRQRESKLWERVIIK